MKTNQLRKDDPSADINISPMIDMVFILLTFFILTTVFVEEQGLGVDMPHGCRIEELDAIPVKLHVASNDQLFCGDDQISIQDVRGKVAEALRKEVVPVVVQVEKDVTTDKMVSVIDQAGLGGAKRVLVTYADARL